MSWYEDMVLRYRFDRLARIMDGGRTDECGESVTILHSRGGMQQHLSTHANKFVVFRIKFYGGFGLRGQVVPSAVPVVPQINQAVKS